MAEDSIAKEIEGRIHRHLSKTNNKFEVSLIWRGYVAALLEWGNISPSEHDRFREILSINEIFEEELKIVFLDCDI